MLGAAQLDGQPMPIFEMLSYFLLLVVAGNETTRNATSGGVQALIDNPEQWKMLTNPALLRPAIEEIVPLDQPGHPVRAHCDRGLHAARPDHQEGSVDGAFLSIGQSR